MIAHVMPSRAITRNAARQPNESARKPTTGPASAPPIGPPAWLMPAAVARSPSGNHVFTTLLAVDAFGPSPIPNAMRTRSIDQKPETAAVSPHAMDQPAMETVSTRRPPNRSAK
ncbi:hypothetical protein OKW42_008132 [Paraburkholderia sp. WC7.3d]